MSTDESSTAAPLRWGVYWILIAISAGAMTGRILAVNSVDRIAIEKYLRDVQKRPDWQQQRPFLSGNDRSRWATIRALVEHGTYRIDDIVSQPNWDVIDMVKHDDQGNPAPGPDEGHLYSSKPPLLATLMAGEYWIIYNVTGATLGDHPYAIGRAMLITWNVLPMIVMLVCIARIAERYARTDWARVFVVAAAAFCTFLSTFVVVLNNHTPAAASTAIALDAGLLIFVDGRRGWGLFFLAGFFGALAAANELPALSFFAILFVALFWCSPRLTLVGLAPAALLVAAVFFGTNYAAHHTFTPPYSQRLDEKGWYAYQYRRGTRIVDSYWMHPETQGAIDRGEPDQATYAFHVLVGHHGIFSLTPIWLLSFIGLPMLAFQSGSKRWVGLGLLAVSIVCVAFYIWQPMPNRNYGGMTSGMRWAFWMAPLWLFGMLPILDLIATRRWLQAMCLLMLAASALSVAYPTWNPWVHPWLLDYLMYLDAVGLGPS
ncbi:MAG TPA: hypothetical protein VHV77_01055 [Pirellulales bacterium]|nr:hypothetical protein [Pirellulales bacterium]